MRQLNGIANDRETIAPATENLRVGAMPLTAGAAALKIRADKIDPIDTTVPNYPIVAAVDAPVSQRADVKEAGSDIPGGNGAARLGFPMAMVMARKLWGSIKL